MTTKTRSDKASTAMAADTASDVEPKGLKEAATGVADEAGRTIEKTAGQSMSQVVDLLHQVADAVRQSSETLQMEQPQAGRFIAIAADKLDEAATFVSDREPTQLMGEAQQIARRQPALVIGGGLVAGLLIGRALRSAGAPPSAGATTGQDWYAAGYRSTAGDRTTGSDVGSGYGTGYGASYDQANSIPSRRGNGSGHLTRPMANGGASSDPAEV